MKLSEIISEETVIFDIEAKDKKGAIRELVAKLAESGRIPKDLEDRIFKEVMRRESLGTTGIGNTGAVPHAKLEEVIKQVGAFGRSATGVGFDSLDGSAVHSIFLVVSPASNVQAHLQALKRIFELIKHEHFCRFVKETQSHDSLLELLREFDAPQEG